MTSLVKMEWYKLRTTKMFIVLAAVTAVINMAFVAVVPMAVRAFGGPAEATAIADAIASPFGFGLLMIPVFISAVSFLYYDFAGGFIKNYAGQVGTRDKIVAAKFIVLGIHNLIFFALGSLSHVLGLMISGTLVFDGSILAGIGTLLLKWLLSMAICSILMFIAVGAVLTALDPDRYGAASSQEDPAVSAETPAEQETKADPTPALIGGGAAIVVYFAASTVIDTVKLRRKRKKDGADS